VLPTSLPPYLHTYIHTMSLLLAGGCDPRNDYVWPRVWSFAWGANAPLTAARQRRGWISSPRPNWAAVSAYLLAYAVAVGARGREKTRWGCQAQGVVSHVLSGVVWVVDALARTHVVRRSLVPLR
jgi:hypothetical protein